MIIKSSLLFDGPRQTMPVWFSFLYFFDWASQLKDAIEANGVESEGRATVAPLAVERGSSFFFVLCCCCCCCCCCGPFLGAGDVVSSRFLLRFYVFFFPLYFSAIDNYRRITCRRGRHEQRGYRLPTLGVH